MPSANLGLIDETPLGYSDTTSRCRSILFFYIIGELRMDAADGMTLSGEKMLACAAACRRLRRIGIEVRNSCLL